MKIIILISLILLTQSAFINNLGTEAFQKCDETQYRRPEIFHVRGSATLGVAPTIAKLDLGIEIKHELAAQALSIATNISNTSISALNSIPNNNSALKVSTSQFSLQPHVEYKWNQKTQTQDITFQGYRVYNNIQIETDNLKIVGSLIDAAVNAGISNVNSVTFDIRPEERTKHSDTLLDLSIQDAKHKAQITLNKLNMKIIGIKSISVDANYAPRPVQYENKMMAMDAMAGSAPTEIFAQDQSLTQHITVGFIIGTQDD